MYRQAYGRNPSDLAEELSQRSPRVAGPSRSAPSGAKREPCSGDSHGLVGVVPVDDATQVRAHRRHGALHAMFGLRRSDHAQRRQTSEVHDMVSAQLARTLLDATVAHPRPLSGPSHRDVTVVIPVRDNASGLIRLVAALRGLKVVIVDDGSARPRERISRPCTATCGSCATPGARGRRRPATPVSRSATPTSWRSWIRTWCRGAGGWKPFSGTSDPTVALVAPRIVALEKSDSVVARYEAVRSSLDLGLREAPVIPFGTVSYARRDHLLAQRPARCGRFR